MTLHYYSNLLKNKMKTAGCLIEILTIFTVTSDERTDQRLNGSCQ
jgi:hypothetical protein